MINIVVEGESDREAAKAIVASTGRKVAKVVVAGGKTQLDPKIAKYNLAARRSNWIVFRDSDGQCPVEVRTQLSANIIEWSPRFLLRIAHSMTEAWLMADRDGFAAFFRLRVSQIPTDPESLPHAKQALLQMCESSRSRTIRRDMVRSSGRIGPLYVHRINEFASTVWDIRTASENSRSLHRTIQRIGQLP